MVINAVWIHSLSYSNVFGSEDTKTRSLMCLKRKKVLNQVTCGAKRIKLSHPHQHVHSSDAEGHRSGIDEGECSNGEVLRPVGIKKPGIISQLRKQQQRIHASFMTIDRMTLQNVWNEFDCSLDLCRVI
ncbi:hypothetical protein AVEN_237307-1 [Araneus ventricosus]|uniref:Uncharacterized protein n=1 Tax=Araneus ventricosus TaxID=182803 RepID=A0A4Y2DM94_ARAVE|nr:hypothetical protein AVEN_237307-1 [Araneus ventricosus]